MDLNNYGSKFCNNLTLQFKYSTLLCSIFEHKHNMSNNQDHFDLLGKLKNKCIVFIGVS